MRYDEIRAVLKTHFTQLLNQHKEAIAKSGRMSEANRRRHETSIAIAHDLDFFDQPHASPLSPTNGLIEKYDLTVPKGSEAYQLLRMELRNAYQVFCQQILDHDSSLEENDFSSAQSAPPQVIEAAPDTISLEALIDTFITERVRGGNWTARTEKSYRSQFSLLCEILSPEAPCSTLGIVAARKVKETLQQVPKNLKISPKTRDLSLEEALALENVERMSVKNINKYLATYNSLFNWADENGYINKNVFANLTIKQRKTGDKAREAFTDEQIELLLDTIVHNERGLIKKDYQKWGPLIGLYTGARLNEIAQLELDDIRQEDGIWCFDINDRSDGKTLKTTSAVRLVPVHSKLIDLGFIKYVDGLREGKNIRLLHELGYSTGTGYGRNLSRWFNGPFLTALGMDKQTLVFHSFRHTMVTTLLQSGVADPLVKSIVGHAQEGVTQVVYFGEGYAVAQKQEAMEKVSWKQ